MKTISYVMRKTILPNSKLVRYIIIRYTFVDNKLSERFWVNTYYNYHDAKAYFKIILDNAKFYKWNIMKEIYCKNIWELQYGY